MGCNRKTGDPGGPALTQSQQSQVLTAQGKDPRFVTMGRSGKATSVRVSQRMYDTLPVDGSAFLSRDLLANYVAALGVQAIAQIQVPVNTVLDLSEVRYRVIEFPAGLGVAIPDFSLLWLNWPVIFGIDVDGKNPWDQHTNIPGIAVPFSAGQMALNQNVMASWSDIPTHLVIQPGQVVTFNYNSPLGGNPLPINTLIAVQVRGRWIPSALWEELKDANR